MPKGLVPALGTGVLSGLMSLAHAQVATPSTDVAASDELAEVVVTAEKRAESIQRVGAAITAISDSDIADARIQRPMDIATLTPGLSTLNMTVDGTPTFAIRGVGLDDFNPNNSSATAVYVDGIYQSAAPFLDGSLFDVGRIEVLKGPQGTLYGRNATGGAVSITSNTPKDQLEGYLNVGYGRWQTLDVTGAISGPIAPGLTGRIAGTLTDQAEGWQKDIDTGQRYGRTQRRALRAMLQFRPNDRFSVLLSTHLNRDTSTPSSYQSDRNEVPGCPSCAAVIDTGTTRSDLVKAGGMRLYRDNTIYGVSLTTTLNFDFASLTSVFGYDVLRINQNDNNQGQPWTTYHLFQRDGAQQAYEEIRLTSNTPLFGKTDWLVGQSFGWQQFHLQDSSDQSTPFVGLFLDPPDVTATGLSVAQANSHQNPSYWGIFLHTTTHLTDDLRVILGGRFAHDRLAVRGESTEDGSADGGILFQGVGSVITQINRTVTSNRFNFRAGIEYDLSKSVLSYANISSATKAGQFYLGPALDPANWQYAKVERLLAYEMGVKATAFDRRLIVNPAIFYYDYKDRQSAVAFISPATGLFVASLGNIPKSRLYGAELDVSVRPIRALTLNAGATYLKSEVRETIFDVGGATLLSNIPVGLSLAQSPRYSFLMSGKYELPLTGDLSSYLHLDYRWTDKQKNTLADPNAAYGPDQQLNGRLGLTSSHGWELALWGRNLTNFQGLINAYSDFFEGRTIQRMQPISYGVEVDYRF